MLIFAMSGSLRAASGNTALLAAARRLAPADVAIHLFAELEFIPPFNSDRESEVAPPAVVALREGLKASDAFLISTPEYAHGVPGVLKNALDWLVGSGELYEKPVAILQTSLSRGAYARASLRETLSVMGAKLVFEDAPPEGADDAQLTAIVRALVDALGTLQP